VYICSTRNEFRVVVMLFLLDRSRFYVLIIP
jgi:hypothetical protein